MGRNGAGKSGARWNGSPRFVDADGHILEHPTRYYDLAPSKWKERIWHIVTDDKGAEWLHFNGEVRPAAFMSAAGVAGMPHAKREAAFRGQVRYTEVRPAAYNPVPRLKDMDTEGIDQSVLYPTMLLGLASVQDAQFAAVQCRVYNDWLIEYCAANPRRLFGVAAIPQQDMKAAVKEVYRAKEKGLVGVFVRPNPIAPGVYFDDPAWEPLWKACDETGLPVGFHPFLAPDLPGSCTALHLNKRRTTTALQASRGGRGGDDPSGGSGLDIGNVYFTQAIANPFDMMLSVTYLLAGGVAERYPNVKFIFLEANGGWIVPWLERLDHHAEVFKWDVSYLKMLPSEYFRRQCWISFDTDESTLAFTASSRLVGADRIIWASDYPHPDAKYPGTTRELRAATKMLSPEDQARVYGENAADLYALPKLAKVAA